MARSSENLPLAGQFVDDQIKATFKESMDGLVADLGRAVVLQLDSQWVDCSNCGYDNHNRRSNRIYNTDNPNNSGGASHKPFIDGQTCPVCRGKGKLNTPQTKTFTALISKKPKDITLSNQTQIHDLENLVSTFMQVAAYDWLTEARFILIDDQQYTKIQEPVKEGLGDLEYAKCIWRRSN